MKKLKNKHPDIVCKCGKKVKDMCYCEKCKQINFSKRKIEIVGAIVRKADIMKCSKCNKKTIPDKSAVIFGTKKWDGHTYRFDCKCLEKNIRLNVG